MNADDSIDELLGQLRAADSDVARTVIVAESVFRSMPIQSQRVARAFVAFHWFDESIVSTLVTAEDEPTKIFADIRSLPFVEAIDSRFEYHALTRKGLFQAYGDNCQSILIDAARSAAPAFAAHPSNESGMLEALYCSLLASEIGNATKYFDALVLRANDSRDWSLVDSIVRIIDEAEAVNFSGKYPDSPQKWMVRGLANRMNGRPEAALANYGKAIELDPNQPLAYLNRAVALRKSEPAAAMADVNRALAITPTNVEALHLRGMLEYDAGNVERAIESFTQAISVDTEYAEAYISRGLAFRDENRLEDAVTDFGRAADLDPKLSSAYFNRGLARLEMSIPDPIGPSQLAVNQDQLVDAIADFTHALDRNPVDSEALSNRAIAYRWRNEPMLAIQDCRRALAIHPNDLGVLLNLLASHAEYGELSTASDIASRVLPQLEGQVYPAAGVNAVLGNREAALKLLAEYLSLESSRKAISWVWRDPDFRGLRSDPRFLQLFTDDPYRFSGSS